MRAKSKHSPKIFAKKKRDEHFFLRAFDDLLGDSGPPVRLIQKISGLAQGPAGDLACRLAGSQVRRYALLCPEGYEAAGVHRVAQRRGNRWPLALRAEQRGSVIGWRSLKIGVAWSARAAGRRCRRASASAWNAGRQCARRVPPAAVPTRPTLSSVATVAPT
jgi:hypothetical protein